MLIINADDYGRCCVGTNRIISCYEKGSITSTSAMVFMEDSERAAEVARHCGIDVGLHLNFTEKLARVPYGSTLPDYHNQIASFLTKTRYSSLFYSPWLRRQFQYVYQAQLEEFMRLYRKPPSHVDGHHHMRLCANMLMEVVVPAGQKVRRNFTFRAGDKGFLNRTYRAGVDKWLARRYVITDYLFSLRQTPRSGRPADSVGLAREATVELESHPENVDEFEWLMSNECTEAFSGIRKATYGEFAKSGAYVSKSTSGSP